MLRWGLALTLSLLSDFVRREAARQRGGAALAERLPAAAAVAVRVRSQLPVPRLVRRRVGHRAHVRNIVRALLAWRGEGA